MPRAIFGSTVVFFLFLSDADGVGLGGGGGGGGGAAAAAAFAVAAFFVCFLLPVVSFDSQNMASRELKPEERLGKPKPQGLPAPPKGVYSRNRKVGNPIASILKSNV